MQNNNSIYPEDHKLPSYKELDVRELLTVIWAKKLTILFFLVVSVPISVITAVTIEPTFVATSLIEKPNDTEKKQTSLLRGTEQNSLFALFTDNNMIKADNTHLAVLTSDIFLKSVLVENQQLDYDLLNEYCPSYGIPDPYTVSSILIFLGLSDLKNPTEKQKLKLLINCVKRQIEIGPYQYAGFNTDAIQISVSSPDPQFSATLSNQIVQKYFQWTEKARENSFENIKSFLSDTISEAQSELIQANKSLQSFLIEHAAENSLIQTDASADLLRLESPFAAEMKRKIDNLGQIEKTWSQFKDVRSLLVKLKSKRPRDFNDFLSSLDIQGVVSRSFVSSLSKIDKGRNNFILQSDEIIDLIDEELARLDDQIQAFEKKINEKESDTVRLMKIEDRFQELALNAQKKLVVFEGLKDQLNANILETEFSKLGKPTLLSEAVAPIVQSYPRKRLTVFIGMALFLNLGLIYVAIRHLTTKQVYNISQVKKLSRFIDCYKLDLKKMKKLNDNFGNILISQTVFSKLANAGKIGCVMDLSSNKTDKDEIPLLFSTYIGKLFSKKKIGVIRRERNNFKALSPTEQKQSHVGNDTIGTGKNLNDYKVNIFDDENNWLQDGDLESIQKEYADFDKIFCALGSNISDMRKFEVIEKCDFYLLVGRRGIVTEHDIKKFSNEVLEKEKKCIGFFLIS